MTDREIQDFLGEMKILFDNDIADPETYPIKFKYQCKVTNRYIKKRNKENEEKSKQSEPEGTHSNTINVVDDTDDSSSNNRTVGE